MNDWNFQATPRSDGGCEPLLASGCQQDWRSPGNCVLYDQRLSYDAYDPSNVRAVASWCRAVSGEPGTQNIPAYWTVLAISVVLLYLSPSFFGNTYSTMQLPKTAWSWMQNIFLLDLSNSETVISPPAWTLTVEFFFYIAMPLLLVRTKITALVWLIISFVYTICLVKLGALFRHATRQ